MPIRTSGGGCGGFLLGWCIFWGILAFLAGLGHWGQLGAMIPGFWIIVPILALGIAVIAALIR
jgi:hypothetical protein